MMAKGRQIRGYLKWNEVIPLYLADFAFLGSISFMAKINSLLSLAC